MSARGRRGWLLVAVLALAGALGLARWRGGPGNGERTGAEVPSTSRDLAPEPSVRCPEVVATRPGRGLPSADAPPVLLVADAPLLAFLDGAPWYSGPESPRRLEPGPHTLRLEAPGRSPLELRFEVERYAPVLLHGAALPGLGVTLVRLGGRCLDCAAALEPVVLEPAEGETPFDEDALPSGLAEAAEGLRRREWSAAAKPLRRVARAHRGDPRFVRLAAGVLVDAGQSDAAEALLRSSTRAGDPLHALLERHAALVETEQARRRADVTARWNGLTGRLFVLLGAHGEVLPGAAAESVRRFAELSAAFAAAPREEHLGQREALVEAAEATLRAWLTQLVRSRPDDCALQEELRGVALSRARSPGR